MISFYPEEENGPLYRVTRSSGLHPNLTTTRSRGDLIPPHIPLSVGHPVRSTEEEGPDRDRVWSFLELTSPGPRSRCGDV